jgi:hypothetical protein
MLYWQFYTRDFSFSSVIIELFDALLLLFWELDKEMELSFNVSKQELKPKIIYNVSNNF